MTMHAHTMKATADRANEIAHMIEMKNIDEAIVKAAKEGRYCIHMPIYTSVCNSW